MQVVYALQDFPDEWTSAIFLAGPTPRAENPTPSWRPEALKTLEALGYDGVVFVPEAEDGNWAKNYLDQINWETAGLKLADAIVFWVPRDLDTMPAFTTNVEFGRWVGSCKTVLGHPKDAPKTRYLDALLADVSDGHEEWHPTLEGTLKATLERLGGGDKRSGGERYVPLHIWQTPMFQSWYTALKAAGNRLDEADVHWTFLMPKARIVFSWVLWVKVWIEAEDRFKENEWVFSRTDISTVVLYQSWVPDDLKDTSAAQFRDVLMATELALIREFRSPVRNDDGMVHELPGGSSKEDKSPLNVAKEEVREETGLKIAARRKSGRLKQARRMVHAETGLVMAAERFRTVGSRQVAATLSSHQAHAFAVALTDEEMSQVRQLAASGETQGVEEDTELTYMEIRTLGELLEEGLVGWSMVGMVTQALLGAV